MEYENEQEKKVTARQREGSVAVEADMVENLGASILRIYKHLHPNIGKCLKSISLQSICH